MKNEYPENVKRIVDDYIERVSLNMGKMSEVDKDDFLREIESHIYESFQNQKSENDVDKILQALKKFGEPSEVFQNHGAKTMYKIGKEKNIPLYILIGALIAIFGLPLGFGGLGLILGLLGIVVGIFAAYFATALGFALGGLGGILASTIHIVDPTFFTRITGEPIGLSTGFISFPNNTAEGIFGIFVSLILLALGSFMLFAGKYIFRGIRSVTSLSINRIGEIFKKNNKR